MNAYTIGVSIVLANGVSPALAIIGRDLLGIHTSASHINHNFGGWATAIGAAGLALGGAGLLGIMGKLVEKSADFQDAMTKISQLNPKVAQLVQSGEIQKLSFSNAANLGMKVEDIAKVYGGIYGVLQDPKEAEELTPIAARYARLMQMRHPGSHPEETMNTAVRAGELSGRLTDDKGNIDPKKVEDWFDFLAKSEAATHGQFTPEVAFGLAQQAGGGAMRNLSEEGMMHMAILSQMMGGRRAGTALLSLRGQMTGAMLKRSALAMQDYGLLKPDEVSSEGGHVSLTEEATKRLLGVLNKDPVAFVDMMVKELEKKGITSKEDQLLAVSRMIGRQTSQREITDILLSRQQMQRETEGMKQGVTVRQGLEGYDKNIHAAQQNMDTAWHNLAVAIGGPEGERFAMFLNKIASAVNGVTAAVNRLSPDQIDTIFKVITGIAVGMIALSGILSVALVSTMVGGAVLLGGAITAVTAAFAAFIYLDWDNLKNSIKPIVDFLISIPSGLNSVIDSIVKGFGSAIDGIMKWQILNTALNGISIAISSFIDAIAALYSRIKGFLPSGGVAPGSGVAPGGGVDPGKPDILGIDPAGRGTSPGKTGHPWHPTSFDPGTSRPEHQQYAFALDIDGERLAQTVIDKFDSQTNFPTGAPSADRSSRWAAGDDNYSDYA